VKPETKASLRVAFEYLILVIAAFPLTFIVTFLLMPLWNWVESDLGIGAVGHSGPADWCFLTVFSVSLGAGLLLKVRHHRRRLAHDRKFERL
jgi:hypothetical protein